MQNNKKNFIQSPLNYVGGKREKIFKQIYPYFESAKIFVEPFCGGGNVFANAQNFECYLVNDIQKQLIDLYMYWKNNTIQDLLDNMDSVIEKYKLSKTNAEGYNLLRDDYNKTFEISLFYPLICYTFNNNIRFNSKDIFNSPFGKNRSSFNPTLREKFIEFHKNLINLNIDFFSLPYLNFMDKIIEKYDSKDIFVYLDPPYYNAYANYNLGWGENDEINLYKLLDKLTQSNIKFVLSNSLENRGIVNKILKKEIESDKYKVVYLDFDYSNCVYNKANKGKNIEILITNKK